MAHKKRIDYTKYDFDYKSDNPRDKILRTNRDILSKIIGKKVEVKSSYFPQKRLYKVDNIVEASVESSSGSFIPAFRLVDNKVSKDKHIVLNAPTDVIEEKTIDNNTVLVLKYEHELNIEKSFKHLHKNEKPPLMIYITIK